MEDGVQLVLFVEGFEVLDEIEEEVDVVVFGGVTRRSPGIGRSRTYSGATCRTAGGHFVPLLMPWLRLILLLRNLLHQSFPLGLRSGNL